MKRLLAAALLCLWVALAGAADGLVALPTLQARVTDLTATLSQEQRQDIEARLAAVEARQGAQIAVLLLPSTQPETIEQFGIRLAEAWKVGRKGVDDGVIVIVAKDDRRLRIEVGYGLEGALNDATAKRIVSETMTPRFKLGDYFGGLQAGLGAIIAVVAGEALPAPVAAQSRGGTLGLADIGENVFIGGLIAVAVVGTALRFFLGNLVGSGLVGGMTGVLGWLFIGGLTGALVGAAIGIFLALFGLDLVLSGLARSGGSRGGGGGFGGGGGSFGGGGASGSW